jgi:hypothetical protein
MALFLGSLGAEKSLAQPDLSRIGRQIRIMEKVIDQVLVDSQHALVTTRPNCRGMRLDGYGVLFVVELSPISSEGGNFHFQFKEDGSYNVIFDDEAAESGRKRTEGRVRSTGRRDSTQWDIEYEQDSDDDDEEQSANEEPSNDSVLTEKERKLKQKEKEIEDKERLKEWVEHLEQTAPLAKDASPEREAALELVRNELVGALRDYGYSITGLKPDEHVAIVIFPSDLDWRAPDTRTIIQVQRKTIEAYNESRLSAEEFAKQVEVRTQ